jgi:DNA-binding NarL/FixJ family response regulator
MSTRVLIADDHAAIRAGLTSLFFGTECEVAAQAVNCGEAVSYTLTCHPDVVLMDLRMPGGDSIGVIDQIKATQPNTRVLIFTAAESVSAMLRTHEAGADGYLLKGASRDDLLAAIRGVARGERGWSRRQLQQIGAARRCPYDSDYCVGLTAREAQVLADIVEGQTNEQIAIHLGVGSETVKQHIKSILEKLGVDDRTQAALYALQHQPQGVLVSSDEQNR